MGKPIKIRAKVKGDISEVKALMPHDMESGLRRDAETNELIPAHYITELVAEHNGEIVMTAYWGPAVSRNPYVSFSFTGGVAGDTIKIHWEDNQGDSSTTEAVLK
ncbi:MAG: thiosulfate oxidation carrier complex protein SoxZ [Proteobacteria bacterium]|jgi:sulfur-oxidizing protein SoxZ|nr:thiosulfate oxidation carrier complex protein SoxZ [Pseudomonadota bacterium]MCH8301571.1 thiosulfate oxidation carrier complex protein SoxZ [Pseudomonadota bacterium]